MVVDTNPQPIVEIRVERQSRNRHDFRREMLASPDGIAPPRADDRLWAGGSNGKATSRVFRGGTGIEFAPTITWRDPERAVVLTKRDRIVGFFVGPGLDPVVAGAGLGVGAGVLDAAGDVGTRVAQLARAMVGGEAREATAALHRERTFDYADFLLQ